MDKKYRVKVGPASIVSVDATGAETVMAQFDGGLWDNMSYEDLVKFEGVMMQKMTDGLSELGMGEAENKKKKIKT